jgi:hypothetical protein
MMPGVLVQVGARQEGACCDVIVSEFCGLVLLGCLGFLLFWVLLVFFLSFLFFLVFVLFLYTSHMLRGAFMLFINFLLTYQKKVYVGLVINLSR